MPQDKIIRKLAENHAVFQSLLEGLPPEEYQWKVTPEKWNLLEVICHLRDEEVEDFRTRVKFHIRQITRLKYDYLQFLQPEISIDYAGNWI